MQDDTVAILVCVGLILGYAWSVRNLARLSRRPPASDGDARGTRIVVDTSGESRDAAAVAAGDPKSASRRAASGSRN
jgi:hypothetical protein